VAGANISLRGEASGGRDCVGVDGDVSDGSVEGTKSSLGGEDSGGGDNVGNDEGMPDGSDSTSAPLLSSICSSNCSSNWL
jgi:hypothetical protein